MTTALEARTRLRAADPPARCGGLVRPGRRTLVLRSSPLQPGGEPPPGWRERVLRKAG